MAKAPNQSRTGLQRAQGAASGVRPQGAASGVRAGGSAISKPVAAASSAANASGISGASGSATGSSISRAPKPTAAGGNRQTATKDDNLKPRPKRGQGLRTKFMLTLAGVTAAAMIVLGVSMATTTNTFLFNQKLHDGIEIAKLASQVGAAVLENLQDELKDIDRRAKENERENQDPKLRTEARATAIKRAENRLTSYLDTARNWAGQNIYSDVLAVRFEGSLISGYGIGDEEKANTERGLNYTRIYIPRMHMDIELPPEIQVYNATKTVAGGQVPIYRFKINLVGPQFGSAANIRVDVAAESVSAVRNNLYLIIAIAVLAGIGLVIVVANYLAGNITRPLDLLLKDMQVVARGNLNHQTKPRSRDEIGYLAQEFNRMTTNLNVAQAALVEQEKAEYELSLAREVQRQLLPAEAPQLQGYDCAAFYQGAKAVSGDYFDIIPLGNGLWGFIVADVSGKGIPGSMVMAVTRTIVRLVANKHQFKAAETLKETNRLIAKQIKRGMFVTAFYAILDEGSGTIAFASAGHNPMIIYRAATKTYELATTKGIAIGFNEGPIFDKTVHESRTTLEPNDAILLYTDGFPEAMNAENLEFGDERFYQEVARLGHLDSRALIANLVNSIAKHRGDAEQSDDLTIITVRRTV